MANPALEAVLARLIRLRHGSRAPRTAEGGWILSISGRARTAVAPACPGPGFDVRCGQPAEQGPDLADRNAVVGIDALERAARHRSDFGVLRALNDGNAAGILDRQQ